MKWISRAVVVGGLILGSFALAVPAFAHASLSSSDPSPGATLATSPGAVTLAFTESVGLPQDALRLLDRNGDVVALTNVGHGASANMVTATVPKLADGLYVVSWRVVSADGHPVSGAYTFTVGPATGLDPSSVVDKVLQGARPDRSLVLTAGVVRWVFFVAFAVLIGVVGFPLLTGFVRDRRWRVVAEIAAGGAAVSSAAAFALGVPLASGRGFGALWSSTAWSSMLDTTAGRAGLIRMILLVLAAPIVGATLGTRRFYWVSDAILNALLGAAVVVSAWAGHGGTGRYIRLGILLTVLHTAAMGLWLGGLAVLWFVLARDGSASAVIRRFSTIAFGCVVVIVATGVAQSWRQLGGSRFTSLSGWTDAGFGRYLSIKVLLVVAMVAVAAQSRLAVRRREGVGLRTRVMAEFAIGLAVLGMTSALVVTNPSVGAASTGSVTVQKGDDAVFVSVFIEPARAGTNTVHVTLRSPDFGTDTYSDVSLTAALPGRRIGPFDVALEPSGPNHFVTSTAQFPYAGTWTLTVRVGVSEFDRRVFNLKVRVRS